MFSLVLCLIHVFSEVYLTVSRIACPPGLALAPVLIGPLPGNAVPLGGSRAAGTSETSQDGTQGS